LRVEKKERNWLSGTGLWIYFVLQIDNPE